MSARQEAAPQPRRRNRVLVALLSILALLILAAAAGAAYVYHLISPTGAPAATLEILPTTSLDVIAGSLERRGLSRSIRLFETVYHYKGYPDPKEGIYHVSGKMNLLEIADALAGQGAPRTFKVTLPEGWRATQVLDRFAQAGLWSKADLKPFFTNPSLSRFTRGHKNLEGFLFPATYDVRRLASPGEVAQMLLDRFALEVTPEREARLRALNLDVYGWVTLASLVQAEAGNDQQMPYIAGVFLNRLAIGMPLQSDPSVAYGLNIPMNQLDYSRGDFKKDTPYNTYTRPGLPAGPIGNPGEAALSAVLDAKRNAPDGRPNLYFLHGLHGEFRVNPDYASHLRDLNTYR
ncbi:MAG TPA: endolytic transglycosylase MltG [Deinococcales bacterium]|nr:endolytic transglycosylase MltG [Deinococcales bacterium]